MANTVALFDCRIEPEAMLALTPIMSGGQLASGPGVSALERAVQASLDTTHTVVAMGDMTHALSLALHLAGVRSGDEVMTLAYNCLSSNAAINAVGARPVWVDIDPSIATMALDDAAAAMTPRTRAVIVYHVAGYPADLAAWRTFCDAHDLCLIEDANNAWGASRQGLRVGTVGDFAVFSCYPNRQVNGIEGAVLVCADDAQAEQARRLRRFGIDMACFRDPLGEIDPACDVPEIGMSSPMNHVNATLALNHLSTLPQRLKASRHHARHLARMLPHGIHAVDWRDDAQPAFWALLVRCDGRDAVMSRLKRAGVQCSKLHQPNDRYSGFSAMKRDLPGTRAWMAQVLALPCGWWLSNEDLEVVVHELSMATASC